MLEWMVLLGAHKNISENQGDGDNRKRLSLRGEVPDTFQGAPLHNEW